MKTTNLIQMEANVVKITSLKKGNVFKLLEKDYGDSYKTMYGIVLDLHNNGERSFLEVLLYEKTYSEIKATIKVFDGASDLNIFPATPEEVSEHLNGSIADAGRKIEEKKKELYFLEEAYRKAKLFIDGEMSKQITATDFSQLTQIEYNKKKQELLP